MLSTKSNQKPRIVRISYIRSNNQKIFLLDLTFNTYNTIKPLINNYIKPRLRPTVVIPKLTITNQNAYTEYRKALIQQGITVLNWRTKIPMLSQSNDDVSEPEKAYNKLSLTVANFIDLTLIFSSLHNYYQSRYIQLNRTLTKIIENHFALQQNSNNILVLIFDPQFAVNILNINNIKNDAIGKILYYGNDWLSLFSEIYMAIVISRGYDNNVKMQILKLVNVSRQPYLIIEILDKYLKKFAPEETDKQTTTTNKLYSIADQNVTNYKPTNKTEYQFKKFISASHTLNISLERKHIPDISSITFERKELHIPTFSRFLTQKDERIIRNDRIEQYSTIIPAMIRIMEDQGIKIKKVDIDHVKPFNSNRVTLVSKVRFHIQLPGGQEDILEVELPQLIDNYYFYVNGRRKIMTYQLLSDPITIVKPYTVRIHTMYQVATVTYNPKKRTSKIYTVGVELNPAILFMVHGRKKFFNLFGWDYEIV